MYSERAESIRPIVAAYYGANVEFTYNEATHDAEYSVSATTGITIGKFRVRFDHRRNTPIWDHIMPSVGLAEKIKSVGCPPK